MINTFFAPTLISLGLFLFTQSSFAQVDIPGESPAKPEYQEQSRALTLRVVPGDRTAKLYIVGHQTAAADLKKQPIVISVTAWNQGDSEILNFQKDGGSYIITELPKWKEPYDLAVKMEIKGKVQEMKVKMNNRTP